MLTMTVLIPFPLPSTWKQKQMLIYNHPNRFGMKKNSLGERYLGNQTGHLVAIELV